MAEASRVLILMRHGKSAYPDDVPDHERPLARRGLREAALAGDWIRATQPPVDAVLCSTSTRTRLTLDATGIDAPAEFSDLLYGATPAQVLHEIAGTKPDVTTLLVIGHDPGIPGAATALDPRSRYADRISDKFPTSALATLTIVGGWSSIHSAGAALTAFHIPR
ncbi:putative enzyme [Rhodococcus sp. RD6.2]|jgi:phosphohistidine phosphatase|uniref:SixA phosphatase family protein n=1 Tax=Rhodococcus sp. RD6.2 TaxID=260936 RepID=UPI00063BB481|nr:histidine phosphatase family protein [Rhodococcus sp. RD6.2]CRK52676.1 putative enzyme [Rhodococcus sp. RD6.2]